ncbi:selenoprotein Pb-like [Mixophyes fleayi]|uniref:selenoprotein Pb-like n=1 Tax=Mixophyes fleayi TaxID=3061075 RepID=UPI003F4DC56E
MRGPAPFITTLLWVLALVAAEQNDTSICKPPPDWSIGDEVPMAATNGRVTVVALLQASCGFCLVQAAGMGPLRDKLTGQGLTNISYMIVNDQSSLSKLMYRELKRRAPPGVPVYQQASAQDDVWNILNGNKDDFLIYDRCGRLTFHIRLPHSFLHFPYVYAAINATYYEDFCQNCSFYANITYTATNKSSVDNTTGVKSEQHLETKILDHKKDKHVAQNSGENHKHNDRRESHEEHGRKPHHPINRKGDNQENHRPTNSNKPPHSNSNGPQPSSSKQ